MTINIISLFSFLLSDKDEEADHGLLGHIDSIEAWPILLIVTLTLVIWWINRKKFKKVMNYSEDQIDRLMIYFLGGFSVVIILMAGYNYFFGQANTAYGEEWIIQYKENQVLKTFIISGDNIEDYNFDDFIILNDSIKLLKENIILYKNKIQTRKQKIKPPGGKEEIISYKEEYSLLKDSILQKSNPEHVYNFTKVQINDY
ncbi:MAG: hypothetical protein AB3N14_01280 [Flavobacteriaceae bacterium]